MPFYLYVLRSLKQDWHYVGISHDLYERLRRHNEGRVISTKVKRPYAVAHYEIFASYTDARKREKFLKSGKGRIVLKELLKINRASVVESADTPA